MECDDDFTINELSLSILNRGIFVAPSHFRLNVEEKASQLENRLLFSDQNLLSAPNQVKCANPPVLPPALCRQF